MKKKKVKELQTIDTRSYNYFQALYMAFYSSRLYVDVAKRWKGFGFSYLLLVIAVGSIPFSARIIYQFNHYFYQQMILPIELMPEIYIQNGKIKVDKPMPYLVKNETGNVVALIDTTHTIKDFQKEHPQATIMITEDTVYFRPPKFQLPFGKTSQSMGDTVFAQPLIKGSNEVFDGKDWIKSSGILTIQILTDVLVYPVMVMFIFGLYCILMLFLAVLGQVFSLTIIKFKMGYKETCRVFFVSATAQILFSFLLITFNVAPPGIGYFYIVILAVYFYFAVFSVKRESNKLVRT